MPQLSWVYQTAGRTQVGGNWKAFCSLAEGLGSEPDPALTSLPFPPAQGPKGAPGKPGKSGEAGLPGLPGVDVSVPAPPAMPRSPLQGSGGVQP